MGDFSHYAEFRVKRNSAIGEWCPVPQIANLWIMVGTTTTLHQHLRAWRKAHRLTLEHLANKIGSKISTISGWETGARTVDLEDLARLAKEYGVHPAALLFAPPGGQEFEQLREAAAALKSMTAEDAADWLRLGRRLAQNGDDAPR